MQWTGSNAEQMRAFVGADFDEIDPEDRGENPDATAAVRESRHGEWRDLEPGYWVVKIGDELYEESDADFTASFEPVVSSPPATDRATVLCEVADRLKQKADALTEGVHDLAMFVAKARIAEAEVLDREADELRRMADEAQQPEPTTADKAAALGMTDAEYRAHSHRAAVDAIRAAIPGLYATVGLHVEDVLADAPAIGARQPDTETPRRGDQFEAWLKAQRDEYEVHSSPQWAALDEVLDTYRLHADTGTPLSEHACDGPHCDCPPPAAGGAGGVADETGEGRCPACGHTVCDGDGPCGALSGDDFCTCPGAMSGQTTADHITQETP